METIEQFASKLMEISDLAFSYGTNFLAESSIEKSTANWTPEEMDAFMKKCHEGFKLAQKRLIEEVISYQRLVSENNAKIKDARSKHDEEKSKEYGDLKEVMIRRLHNLSHIADGIAIQMMAQQIHVAKQLHIGEKSSKHLEHSNINYAVKVADKINEDPANFALISDLTSFIQIGDLLVFDIKKGLYITELKEGKVNERIRKFIDVSLENKDIQCSGFQSDFSEKEHEQLQRMRNQDLRAAQAVEVINTDRGIDSSTGANITVRTPQIELIYYDEIFTNMLQDLQNKEWSYRTLDSCLHIGMYQGTTGLMMAPFTVPQILKNQTENYMVVDFMQITEKLSETLFAKPLPKDFIVKLMTGQAKIIIGIDMDRLIEVFNKNGLKTRWLNKRETGKIKSEKMNLQVVSINNRAIGMQQNDGLEWFMSGGIINKIAFDNILPSSLAASILSSTGPKLNKVE